MILSKKTLMFLIITLQTCQVAMSQTLVVKGTIRDAFDNTGLEKAHVKILNSDSSVVAQATATIPFTSVQTDGNTRTFKNVNSGAVFECSISGHGDYTAVVSMVGYETKRVPFTVTQGQTRKLDIGDIFMFTQAVGLDELTVTSTKLKMYHNGDTLIYNADAFMIDKRNVLEDLVKMLPGVELRDGKVYANGRFVESIVISGKDVMPGNPNQLMKMLPAYIVNKLKFYDKQGEESKTMGKDMLDASYVMDVCLKRDYHETWLGMAEAGGGTKKRWEGSGFGMRFDDRQYLSVSVDANNIGLERENTEICTASNVYVDRQLTNRQINLNYSYHPTDKMNLDIGGLARWQDTGLGTEEKQKMILSNSSDLYKLYMKGSDLDRDYYKGNIQARLRPVKGIYGKLAYSFEYGDNAEESKSNSLTSLNDINASDSLWRQIGLMQATAQNGITSIYTDSVMSTSRQRLHKAETEWHIAMGENMLKMKANVATNHDTGMLGQQYTNRMFDELMTEDRRKNINDTQTKNLTAAVTFEYDFNYLDQGNKKGILKPYYSYTHSNARDRRRMTLIVPEGDGGESTVVDINNSRKIKDVQNSHAFGLRWNHETQLRSRGWLVFNGELPILLKNVNASLLNKTAANNCHKKYTLISPSMEIKWHPKADDRKGNATSLSLKAWCKQTNPNATFLLDQTDTSDPQNIYMGNPDLKKQTDLGVSIGFRHFFISSKHSTYATLSGTKTWNSIAMQSEYDIQSGVKTYSPVNVDGKHGVSFDCGYSMPLTSNQTCWLNLSVESNYTRNANMMYDKSGNQGVEYMKLLGYRAKSSLRWNDKSRKVEIAYSLAYSGNCFMTNSVTNDNVQDLGNSLSITGKLPAGITLSVNCNVVSRFGYAMESLNETLVLTNAKLSKSLFKDKLVLWIEAVDIFHQRNHIKFKMNNEEHTETKSTQYIPAYILASVRYNWSYTPKKKL